MQEAYYKTPKMRTKSIGLLQHETMMQARTQDREMIKRRSNSLGKKLTSSYLNESVKPASEKRKVLDLV